MEELKKINRVIDREYPEAYRETLVVLDATTGQNALAQAREFNEVADITGVILTKMDGTAKGGIAVAIQSELGIRSNISGLENSMMICRSLMQMNLSMRCFTCDSKTEETEE